MNIQYIQSVMWLVSGAVVYLFLRRRRDRRTQ